MSGHQHCLEPEAVAALVDGRLSRRERRLLEVHLASCKECCTVLAEAVRYREEQGLGAVARFPPRRVLWTASALAASVLVAVAVWRFAPHADRESPVLRGMAPLVAVETESRSIDARITGGFSWVPLEPLARSGAGPRTTPAWELLAAASRVKKDAEADPSPENRHALGVAHLVLGDLDQAVSVLRSVANEAPPDATLLNDLGAALLARGELQSRPDDFIEALSLIEKALQLNGSLREALFNRAVALEKLHLDDKAVAAWGDYLGRGPESGWADEARRRLEQLEKTKELGQWKPDRDRLERAAARGDASAVSEIVTRRTQETRLLIQDELLGVWARAAKAGDTKESERVLAMATTLASALTQASGDAMTEDIVSVVRKTTAGGPSKRLQALIDAHVAYQNAVDRYALVEVGDALQLFDDAQVELNDAKSPLALWASYGAARCEYYRTELKAASLRLVKILPDAQRMNYLAVGAHADALQGLMDILENRFDASLAHYQRSLAAFERLHEEENTAHLSSLVGENLGFMGDDRESLRKILAAVSRVPRVQNPGRAVAVFAQAAIAVARQGFPDVAMKFQDAAVERAKRDGDPIDVVDSLQLRARIAADLGRTEPARSDLADARAAVPRVTDPAFRDRVVAEINAAEVRLARTGGDPADTKGALTAAIGYFSQAGHEIRLPEFYLARGRAFRTAGDVAAAERDLRAGVEIFERHRSDILQQTLRVSYFDTAHELFDELIRLEIARARPDAALAYLERGKTREVRDGWPTPQAPAVNALQSLIPEGVAVVAYGVLPDRLLFWTFSHGSRDFAQRPIAATELTQLVTNFRDEFQDAKTDVRRDAERLYTVLIDPVAQELSGFGTVVFVPDAILHAVPFAALADAKTNRFLVEDHAIVVSPSIALFLRASDRRGAVGAATPPSLLAVGDPAFDSTAFPYLPRLSGAAAEAKRIAGLYPDAVLLTGDAATRSRFLAELGRHTVVHVASHALTNDSDPLRSRLLFTPDPEHGDSGTLFAEELYGAPFGKVRLVVLAACSTASGRISRGEGPLSIARPFLAGGVPSVLATMWEIEDSSSTELLTAFHREVAAGRPPEEALRDAQVAMIEGTDPTLRAPRSWAAFQLAGGVDRSARG